MANELQVNYQTGKVVYFLIRDSIGQIWNGSAFESYTTANYSTYVVSGGEQGVASAFYTSTFPSTILAGVYSVLAKERIGGSAAETDPSIGWGNVQWNGSASLPLSDLATSGQIGQIAPMRIARGTMIKPFPFKLVSSADHITPFISGVVSGQISRDGAPFVALQSGAFTEVGLGWYSLQALTSGDLLANSIGLVFNATHISGLATADQRDFGFITQKVSGF